MVHIVELLSIVLVKIGNIIPKIRKCPPKPMQVLDQQFLADKNCFIIIIESILCLCEKSLLPQKVV